MPRRLRYMPAAAAASLSVTLAVNAAAQASGPVVRAAAAEITVGGRVHTQFTTSTVDSVAAQEWVLRRVRLETGVRVNDLVSGRVQLDFAGNRVSVKDAYLAMALDPAAVLLAGVANRPFGLLTQTSSNRVLVAERGARIRGLPEAYDEHNLVAELGYADRDLGIQLSGAPRGAPLGLFYAAGYFNGPARRAAAGHDTYQLAARAGIRPLRQVSLAGSWSRRDFVEDDQVRGGAAWAVDLEVGSFGPGLHLMAEAVTGAFDPFTGSRFAGAQGWLAYRTPPLGGRVQHVEPVVRVSHGDPDASGETDVAIGGTLITPGINLYVGGMNRIQVAYDLWRSDRGRREGAFRTQFQLAF